MSNGKFLNVNNLLRLTMIVFMLSFAFGLVGPEPAYAFDLQKGAQDTLALMKTVVLIVMLVAATTTFLRHQMVAAVVIVIVGAIVLAVTTPGLLETIGRGLLNLVGGDS